MKGFAALAMAAMFVVQVAVTFLGTVSAGVDEATVTFDRVKVQGGWSGILTLTVANSAGAAIDNVILCIPGGWTFKGMLRKVPKDNIVYLVDDNIVVLPAGTVVEVFADSADNIIIPENTDVIIPRLTCFYHRGNRYTLEENALMEPTDNRRTENFETMGGLSDGYVDNEENFRVGQPLRVTLWQDNRLRLLSDTLVVVDHDDVMILPENLLAQVVASNENQRENMDVAPKQGIKVKVIDNHFRVVSDPLDVGYSISRRGEVVELEENIVVIPENTVVKIEGSLRVRIPENAQVIRENDTKIKVDLSQVENVPKGWSQGTCLVGSQQGYSWAGIGDNKIAAGGSESFPFAIGAPTEAKPYLFVVVIKDKSGGMKDWSVQIIVDNSVTVNVSVDKTWVGKNENITITVSSDEPIWFDNVLVCENNAPENVNLEMSTTDNKTYTGVYTTGENEDRDGYLTIRVINVRDEVGNSVSEITKSDLVFVDRRRPGPPSLTALGIPVGIENKSDWTISTSLNENHDNLIFKPAGYFPENLMLEILVDNAVAASGRASSFGLVNFTLTLSEGKHTVAARITDKAGNVGEENSENVVIDLSKPTVTFVSPTQGKKFGRKDVGTENTITISLKLRDTVLGIENYVMADTADEADNENFDRGYIVRLYKDGSKIAVLQPTSYPTLENVENVLPNVFGITADWTFENIYCLGASPEGKYTVEVIAGDNMGVLKGKAPHRVKENVSFEVDLTPPDTPTDDTCTGSIEANKSQFTPTKTRVSKLTLMGTTEPNATVKIYRSVAGGPWTELTSTKAGSDGSWSKDVDLTKGQTMGIKVSYIDEAGNESGMYLYGYLLYDDSPPKVIIDAQYKEFTTDKASVLITGRVQKDDWEDYNDIELCVSPETASVNFNRTNGTFTVSAAVSEGTNLITVEAKDPVGNRGSDTAVVTRTVTPWATYATILVIIALVLAAVAIFRKK
ncbi:MAG: hypothetical protein QXQ45_02215 [Candidatus Hadarchaeales archaeon]